MLASVGPTRTTAGTDKPAKRERNAEDSKRRILEAAENEFARRGYEGARLREVATAAGVHHALLHHYYGDKEGLFRAVIEQATSQVSREAYALMGSTSDIRALVEGYIHTMVDYFAANRRIISIFHFVSLDEDSPAFALCADILEKTIDPLLAAGAATIELAQKEGTLRADISSRRLVSIVIGAAGFVFHEHHFFDRFFGQEVRSPEMLAEHKEATIKLLASGLFTKKG